MSEQTAIPVDESQPTTGPCAWCGAPATQRLEMEPAQWGLDKLTGVRVVKRHAIESWACESHLRSLRPSERIAKAQAKDVKKAGKGVVIR